MDIRILGVRGSRCSPGSDFAGVGGHTSSVVITPSHRGGTRLLLDAGTGLSSVPAGAAPFEGDILLTHLHWDHVQGIPFFPAGDTDDARVRVHLPAQGEATPQRPGSAAALLSAFMSPPHFPISCHELRGRWTFEAIEPGRLTVGTLNVTAIEVPHKGGRTFGYRVEEDGAVMAYLPDFCPRGDGARACRSVAQDVDILLVGGMFSDAEGALAGSFGHATAGQVRALAETARVGTTVVVHHAPNRTDRQVEKLWAGVCAAGKPVQVGREGMQFSTH